MNTAEDLATVPHLDWRTFIDASADTAPDVVKTLDEYFRHFVALEFETKGGKRDLKPQKCVGCGEPLTGFLAALISKGGFTWGLAHGEGHCAGCGWPARGHHFIKDEKGEDLMNLRNFILQFHPDFVERKS